MQRLGSVPFGFIGHGQPPARVAPPLLLICAPIICSIVVNTGVYGTFGFHESSGWKIAFRLVFCESIVVRRAVVTASVHPVKFHVPKLVDDGSSVIDPGIPIA